MAHKIVLAKQAILQWQSYTSPYLQGEWMKDLSPLERAFYSAIRTNDFQKLNDCIAQGVNVNVAFSHDVTALHIAVGRMDLPLALRLAASEKLDFDCQTRDGYTPLIIACIMRSRRFLKFLIRNGADVDKPDYQKKTPLHYVCMADALEMAMALVYKGADINLIDSFGRSPLAVALVDCANNTMARFLLNHGAYPEYDSIGHFQLFLECVLNCNTADRLEGVDLLIHFGVDVNMVDSIGLRNCMHVVGITGFLPLAQRLVTRGASVTFRDAAQRTPLDVARIHGNLNVYGYIKYYALINEYVEDDDDDF